MPKLTKVFKRTEKKYRITYQQYEQLIDMIESYIVPDKFGKSTINNIYFDTPDWRLIRASIEKPTVYKEKLRIRSYKLANSHSQVFVELKKKYKGVVYKRRVYMTYKEATDYLSGIAAPPCTTQVTAEIDNFLSFYKTLLNLILMYF